MIDTNAQLIYRLAQAFAFAHGVFGHGVGNNHARFVQPDMATRGPLLAGGATKQNRLLVARLQRRTFAHKGAQFGHFGQDHGHHFQRVNFISGILARLFRLHHQHAQFFAQALDRNAEEAGINFLASFGHVAKALFRRCVGGVDDFAGPRHAAHQPLAQAHARLVHGLGV